MLPDVVSADPLSAVLADQVKSLDWRARGATRKRRVDGETLADVKAKLQALLLL